MHSMPIRRLRALLYHQSDLVRFYEEFLASKYATQSIVSGFKYAITYDGISGWKLLFESGFLAYVYGRIGSILLTEGD